ncbi:MAG: hypothetical protein AAFU73_09835 [Planctomycetota bacterium]
MQDDTSHDADEPDTSGELFGLLNASDRDRSPGARPMVSVSDGDPPEFLDEVARFETVRLELERRGHGFGSYAELDDSLMFAPREPLKVFAERFAAARPIVLVGALPPELDFEDEDDAPTHALFRRLEEAGTLEPLLRSEPLARPERGSTDPFRALGPRAYEGEPAAERTLDAHSFGWREPDPARPSRSVDDLWVKLQRLSTHPEDASLRVRVSHGSEVADDASRDPHRLRLVGRLAETLFPELGVLHRDEELRGIIGDWIGGRPLFTQSIAYWNAPGGGAQMHHDAFDEPAQGRQRCVLYAQVTGATAWFAASTDDLVLRVQEFAELLEEQSDGSARDPVFGPFLELARSPRRTRAALMQEDASALSPVLHGAPAFHALLADAGHAFVLRPGDAVVLPNNGVLEGTCHHSVFCASPSPGLAFSLAVRDFRGPGAAPGAARGTRGSGGRRGRRRGRRRPGSRRR